MIRISRRFGAFGAVLVLLTGCSGGDDKASAPTTAPSAATTGGPTSTIRPVDTSFSGQNSAQFCTLAKSYTEKFANVAVASTPAALRTVVQDGRTAINAAASAAPAEINVDVKVLANAFGALFTELEKVNFDTTKLSVSSVSSLQTPEFQMSTTRFQAYLRSVCGVTG